MLTGPICSSFFLNPFPPRPAKTALFIIIFTLSNARQFYSFLTTDKGEPLGGKGLSFLFSLQFCHEFNKSTDMKSDGSEKIQQMVHSCVGLAKR